ncbi:MAG: DUF1440 domain-containing protein [Longimicrobiales bacterium]|nr:DUF1440 domain-containing protein [Longimicrobiales bacterium]
MRINLGRTVIAGVIGTAVMTVVGLYMAPMMGLPPMNPAVMLAGATGGNLALGWMAHFMIGVTLAAGYALVGSALPGPGFIRGALFGIAPFLMAQILVMPMMGMPVFSGSAALAMGSLVGHLVYGGVVGGIYGEATETATATAAV